MASAHYYLAMLQHRGDLASGKASYKILGCHEVSHQNTPAQTGQVARIFMQ